MRYRYAVELVALTLFGRERDPSVSRIARVAPHLSREQIERIRETARADGACTFAAPPILARNGYQVLRLCGSGRFSTLERIGTASLPRIEEGHVVEADCMFAMGAVLHARAGWGAYLAEIEHDWQPLIASRRSCAMALRDDFD